MKSKIINSWLVYPRWQEEGVGRLHHMSNTLTVCTNSKAKAIGEGHGLFLARVNFVFNGIKDVCCVGTMLLKRLAVDIYDVFEPYWAVVI